MNIREGKQKEYKNRDGDKHKRLLNTENKLRISGEALGGGMG